VFRPLVDDDAGLAGRLSDRFPSRLVIGMSPSERRYAEKSQPPRFEVGSTPIGNLVLAIDFGGGRSVTGWDGSGADAEYIVDAQAETSAANSEWDEWVQGGGWKEWRGDGSNPL
jgi:hypothetical protein